MLAQDPMDGLSHWQNWNSWSRLTYCQATQRQPLVLPFTQFCPSLHIHHVMILWTWKSCLTSLSLSFLLCKRGLILVFTLRAFVSVTDSVYKVCSKCHINVCYIYSCFWYCWYLKDWLHNIEFWFTELLMLPAPSHWASWFKRQIILMEDGAYNVVLEDNPCLLGTLSVIDAFRIWVMSDWGRLANGFLPRCTVWSSLMGLICRAHNKCSQPVWRLICEPVAIYRPGWVCLPVGNVIGIMCLTVRREKLHSDLTWRNHRGVISSPTDDWCYSVVTNDEYGKWLI